jgi:hypothetical protein
MRQRPGARPSGLFADPRARRVGTTCPARASRRRAPRELDRALRRLGAGPAGPRLRLAPQAPLHPQRALERAAVIGLGALSRTASSARSAMAAVARAVLDTHDALRTTGSRRRGRTTTSRRRDSSSARSVCLDVPGETAGRRHRGRIVPGDRRRVVDGADNEAAWSAYEAHSRPNFKQRSTLRSRVT